MKQKTQKVRVEFEVKSRVADYIEIPEEVTTKEAIELSEAHTDEIKAKTQLLYDDKPVECEVNFSSVFADTTDTPQFSVKPFKYIKSEKPGKEN